MFTITFVEPSGRREQIPLVDEERGLVFGRDAMADVVLQSKEVSRRHARFFVRDGQLLVEDLGSHNGVYIDGNKAEGPTAVAGAQDVELGDVHCTASGSASAKVAPPKIAAAVPASTKRAAATPADSPKAVPAAGSARAGANAARARAASQEQAKGTGPKPVRATVAPVSRAPAPVEAEPASEVKGVGAGATLRSLNKSADQIRLPAKAVVGRDADCDVVLDDDSVSRHHAELFRDERGLYRLRDLGSANGSFIDGRRTSEGELIPEGARLRFGDVELLFWKPAAQSGAQSRQKAMIALIVIVIIGFGILYLLKQKKQAEREAQEAAQVVSPEDEARGLADQAQGALESDHFEDAINLAQAALDKDPLAASPRKILVTARREQSTAKIFADAQAKAAVGNEDEALRLYAQIDPSSRFFARARIKAKDIAQSIVRRHGKACTAAAAHEHWDETADQCASALDVKCQMQDVEQDPWFKALRRAEKSLSRKVLWACPPSLAPLFHDDAPVAGSAADAASIERAMRTLYPDEKLRDAVTAYAQGETDRALRALADPGIAHGKSAQLAAQLSEKIRLVDGSFRTGQTSLLRNDLTRVDELWGEALRADALLVPAGVESALASQMRSTLAQAHGKLGDDKLSKGQYSTAYDEWTRGLAVSPKDPHLLDGLAQLEKVAEGILSSSSSCEQIKIASHITRADPPSPAHAAALEASARCK